MYGAGCYATQSTSKTKQRHIGVSVSGTGECIVRCRFAQLVAEHLDIYGKEDDEDEDIHAILEGLLRDRFWSMMSFQSAFGWADRVF